MTSSIRRPTGVLNIKEIQSTTDFIAKMRGISVNMKNNIAIFPSPRPALTTLDVNLDNLEEAEALTKTGVRGSVQARDEKYDICLDNAHSELNYVQDIADNAADEDAAKTIIMSSGFDLKQHGVRVKPDFEVKNTEEIGTVELIAKSAGIRSANEWLMSTDQIVWTNLPSTLKSSTKVSGLTKGMIVYFRHRPVVKDIVKNWSVIVSIIVT